jgi:hypothetical protein
MIDPISAAINNRDYYKLEELWAEASEVDKAVIDVAMNMLEQELEENGC